MNSRISFISRAGVALAGALLLAACGGDDDKVQVPQFVTVSDADAGAAQRPRVRLTVTNGEDITGTLVITLVPEHAPRTVANFLNYVESGFYDGTVFHRHDRGFVLQGGGYAAPIVPEVGPTHKTTGDPIPLELKVSHTMGTVGMARNNYSLNSATSEFFINLTNNTFLNSSGGGYAAFGYITDMSFVSAMTQATCVASVVTGQNGCLPVPNLIITSAEKLP